MKTEDIKANMPIVSADQQEVGKVERVESVFVKALDDTGKPHWFPFHWVAKVGTELRLDRGAEEAVQDWSDTPPIVEGG